MFFVNAALNDISIGTAGLVALLGYAVVFVGLIALMAVVLVMGKIMVAKKAKTAAAAPAPAAPAAEDVYDSDAVADQISQSLEALVGTAEETSPKAEPRHPVRDTTTSKFANLNLQFGRNYDPTHK